MNSLIIQQWANLSENSYFTPDLKCGTRQTKCPLSKVFQKSQALLTKDCSYDKKLWLEAAQTISTRFEKSFVKKTWIIRLVTRLVPWLFPHSLYAQYNALMELMASLAARKYEGNFTELKNAMVGLRAVAQDPSLYTLSEVNKELGTTSTPHKIEFLDRVFKAYQKRIFSKKKYRGSFYELRRGEKTVGYVIGTIHLTPDLAVPDFVVKDTRLSKIFEKSQRLFVELTDIKNDDIKLRNQSSGSLRQMDSYIMNLFQPDLNQAKKIQALDQDYIYQKIVNLCKKHDQGITTVAINELSKVPPDVNVWRLFEVLSIKWPLKNQFLSSSWNTLLELEFLDASLAGKKKTMEFLDRAAHSSDQRQLVVTKRNRIWLKEKLLPAVRKDTSPFCVAVGAAHLLGEKGLLRAFEKEGLTLRRLNSASDL